MTLWLAYIESAMVDLSLPVGILHLSCSISQLFGVDLQRFIIWENHFILNQHEIIFQMITYLCISLTGQILRDPMRFQDLIRHCFIFLVAFYLLV